MRKTDSSLYRYVPSTNDRHRPNETVTCDLTLYLIFAVSFAVSSFFWRSLFQPARLCKRTRWIIIKNVPGESRYKRCDGGRMNQLFCIEWENVYASDIIRFCHSFLCHPRSFVIARAFRRWDNDGRRQELLFMESSVCPVAIRIHNKHANIFVAFTHRTRTDLRSLKKKVKQVPFLI